jgi:hypothetical protein
LSPLLADLLAHRDDLLAGIEAGLGPLSPAPPDAPPQPCGQQRTH